MGSIYQSQGVLDKAITYFGLAIEGGAADALNIAPATLSKYYLHRAQTFEALGMEEHAKLDLQKIQEADPNFRFNVGMHSNN